MIPSMLTREYNQVESNVFDNDPLVNQCLMHMYFFLLLSDDNPNKEKEFEECMKIYHSFDKEKQEYIKNDFIKIMNAQDENQRQKKKER